MKKILKIAAWTVLWVILFWVSFIATFPSEAVKDWLAASIGKGLRGSASITSLSLRYDLEVRLKGIKIIGKPQGGGEGFSLKVDSLSIKPKIIELLKGRLDSAFSGTTPSGGRFTGRYDGGGLTFSIKEMPLKDVEMSAFPVPGSAIVSATGSLTSAGGKGRIAVEVEGIPGGKQRFALPEGTAGGMDGKVAVSVTLPGL